MDYNYIIESLEEQKRDETLSTKLYRYTGLIQAIEFFSQKLNLEQIFDAAFDFINELLTLEKSAAFLVQNGRCELKKLKGFDNTMSVEIGETEQQNLVKLHGTVLYDRHGLERYFSARLLAEYEITAVTPLIMENALFGFILMSRKTAGDMNHDDHIISEALMRLINNALGNYKRYEDLQRSNRELDEKIFNLFAINQSSKVLLGELNLDVLYGISIDVFAELTQSSSTGFVLLDDVTGRFELKAFKDIRFGRPAGEFSLTHEIMARVDINRVIIDLSDESDVQYFESIFRNGINILKPLNPLYIVLLIKNGRIAGFVTLGGAVTGRPYKKSIFELIESLASATYIAFTNAQLFREVNEQKRLLQTRYKRLLSLNSLIRNINSAPSVKDLLELAMKTLEASFDVKCGFAALYDRDRSSFSVSSTIGLAAQGSFTAMKPNWAKVVEGNTVLDMDENCAAKYLGEALKSGTGSGSGLLAVPIFMDRSGMELLGVLGVFKYGRAALYDEENRLMIETVAGHMAPVLKNLKTIEELRTGNI